MTDATGDRALLYMDILGFRTLVRDRTPDQVYETVNSAIQESSKLPDLFGVFGVLHFSDTIILWQHDPTTTPRIAYAVNAASIIFSQLASRRIPVRGAISYGSFTVRRDSEDRHDVYFGDALIDAHDFEECQKWVGLCMCPSALEAVPKESRNDLFSRGRVRKDGDVDRINPFWHVANDFKSRRGANEAIDAADNPLLFCELGAIRFLADTNNQLQQTEPDSGVAQKYAKTVEFLSSVMGLECWQWAREVQLKTS